MIAVILDYILSKRHLVQHKFCQTTNIITKQSRLLFMYVFELQLVGDGIPTNIGEGASDADTIYPFPELLQYI